jgi:hypothetical protein
LRTARDSGGEMLYRYGGYAGARAGRAADRLSRTFERNPLAIGAIGLLAGALIAALLPASRTADKWLGGKRDGLWQQAQQAGETALTELRNTAAGAADAAAADTVVRETDKPPHV